MSDITPTLIEYAYLLWAIVPIVGILVVAIYSHRHKLKVDSLLFAEVEVDLSTRDRVRQMYGVNEGIVSTVAVADVLYNAVKLDPYVLQGIEHLHHAHDFSNLGEVMEFMRANIATSEVGSDSWVRMVHKYKGYTGEQVVADHLEQEGKAVVFPESPTNEGYDFLVDGTPVDVKTVSQPSTITQHLEKYPEIDIVTNREMSGYFDSEQVSIDDNLSVVVAKMSSDKQYRIRTLPK